MLDREIIAVCSQIHTKHTNTLCGQIVEFVNVKPGGTYSDHWALKCHVTCFSLTRRHTTACGPGSESRHLSVQVCRHVTSKDSPCRLLQWEYLTVHLAGCSSDSTWLCSHLSDTSVDSCRWKYAKFWALSSYWIACHFKCYKIKKPSLGAFQKTEYE
jgi:hypothetical protein